jgi:hypothetical protein
MASICALAVFDSAAAYKVSILPILNTDLSGANDVAAGTKTNIDRITLSQEVKIVTDEPAKSRTQNSLERQMVMKAKKDLVHRLSVEINEINLLEVRQVTWPDSSLGCPQPGKVYNQVSQDGLLIRLEVGGRMYFYHNGGTLDPFFCEQTSQVIPHPTKVDEFVPPPGSEID